MKDIVFLKEDKKEDRLWENTPHLAFTFLIFIGIAMMVGLMLLLVLVGVKSPTLIAIISFFIPTGIITAIAVKRNEDCNLSKSIGFVKRDNILYMIKLGYADIATDVQEAEIEVRERRVMEETYTKALDEILKHLQNHRSLNVNGIIGFCAMPEPRIEKESKKYIWISYNDSQGGRITTKFRNAYRGLNEEIEKQNI